MPHPLSDDLVSVPVAATLMAAYRAGKSEHRSPSSVYKLLKEGQLTDYGGERGPKLVSLTQLALKFGPRARKRLLG